VSFGQSGTNLFILIQPQSQIVPVGSEVSFSVVAGGTGPFSYQWQFNGTNLPNNSITTVAGTGAAGFSGDGGAATNAMLWQPAGVAIDRLGNMFIADYLNDRVRKVNASGTITTIAGGGAGGLGDGGPATNGSLHYPAALAFDHSGNLFIVDVYGQRIRKVSTNGIITTVAGNGAAAFAGDGGPATNASIYYPSGVAVDGVGNLFIGDQFNQRVRKVSPSGIITTVAGNGAAAYSGDGSAATNASLNRPFGVAVDSAGNLFIGDQLNQRVRRVDTNGIITTVAGNGIVSYSGDGGPATNASINNPTGVAVDGSGSLFIADDLNNRVRKVDVSGIITTVAGNGGGGYSGDGGSPTNASINNPSGVTPDGAGNLLIADYLNQRVRKVVSGPPTLTVYNVGATNAGNYTVIVSNPFQSVTSSVAVLQVNVGILVDGQYAAGTVQSVGAAEVAIVGPFGDGPIFYTLDGTPPTISSLLYTDPFILTNTATVQALNLSADFSQSVFSSAVLVRITPEYNLETSVVGEGTISAAPPSGPYASNSVVVLTALAASNWVFDHWAGDITGNQNPASVTMNGPRNVQALFVQTAFPLTVGTPGGGSVTANGRAIAPATYYTADSQVTLAAAASNGWTFLGWTGDVQGTNNPLSVTISKTNNIQAVFGTEVSTSVVGQGSIALAPPNPVPFGTATVMAVPAPGYFFRFWGGALTWTNNPTNLVVNAPGLSVSALFAAVPAGKCTLSVIVNGNGTVAANPRQAYYNQGDTVTLTATPTGAQSSFTGWGGEASGTNDPLSLVLDTNEIVIANFVSLPPVSISLVENPPGAPPGTYAGVTFRGLAGYTYVIQYTRDLANTNSWTTLTNLTLEQPVELWLDTSTNALGQGQRYYQFLPAQ